jgi:hypothetical protein
VSGGVSSLFGTKVGRLVLAWVHRPGPTGEPWVVGFQQAAATPGVQVLAPVAERLVAAASVAIPTDQAPMARTIIDRDLTLLAAFDAQIAEADQHLAALLPPTPFAVLGSGPGGWSGRPPMGPQSASRRGGPAPGISIGPAGCARQPTPRLAAARTAPSAGKARSPAAGRAVVGGRAGAA